MKLYATIKNEKGKTEGMGGNEYLDIDIRAGNKLIAMFTLRENDDGDIMLFDEDDEQVLQSYTVKGKPKGYNSNKDTLLCVKRGCGAIQGESEYCEEHEQKGKSQKGEEHQCRFCNFVSDNLKDFQIHTKIHGF